MHVGNRSMYRTLKFGFLYHATLSSFTACVSTGSAPCASVLSFIVPVAIVSGE